MISWDNYFFEIAKTIALRSNCIRAQVGAVIVDQNKHIKATGYNGVPSKVVSCMENGFCYRIKNNIPSGTRYETCRSIHAEQNSIIQAGEENCRGSVMYIYGHDQICILCKRFIVQSGISKVFLKKNDETDVIAVDAEELRHELSHVQSELVEN
ncbi:MAG: hypothetical protein ACD_20C00287G0003 [uncultured bacterium]|nr:MAG: hypothetical protein ACD_20C00287G0003 [uncultured bacterium]HBH18271.1 cytidine deaminase [Cyanobacteria bacterium UBA9579]